MKGRFNIPGGQVLVKTVREAVQQYNHRRRASLAEAAGNKQILPEVIIILKPAGTQSRSCAESRTPGSQQGCCGCAPGRRDLAELSRLIQLSSRVSHREGVKSLMRPVGTGDATCDGTQPEMQASKCRHRTWQLPELPLQPTGLDSVAKIWMA